MKEYLNNEEATSKFFFVDEDGRRWAKTGDIAEVKYQYQGKDVYDILSRQLNKTEFVEEAIREKFRRERNY